MVGLSRQGHGEWSPEVTVEVKAPGDLTQEPRAQSRRSVRLRAQQEELSLRGRRKEPRPRGECGAGSLWNRGRVRGSVGGQTCRQSAGACDGNTEGQTAGSEDRNEKGGSEDSPTLHRG